MRTRGRPRPIGSWPTCGSASRRSTDFTGDCVADLIGNRTNGELRAWAGTGDVSGAQPAFPGAHALVGTNWTSANVPRVVLGDWNGDNRSDICRVMTNGDLICWYSSGVVGDNQLFPRPFATVGTGWHEGRVQEGRPFPSTYHDWHPGFTAAAYPRLMVGDQDFDGREDIFATKSDGTIWAWRSSGDGPALFPEPARLVGSSFTTANFVRVF